MYHYKKYNLTFYVTKRSQFNFTKKKKFIYNFIYEGKKKKRERVSYKFLFKKMIFQNFSLNKGTCLLLFRKEIYLLKKEEDFFYKFM